MIANQPAEESSLSQKRQLFFRGLTTFLVLISFFFCLYWFFVARLYENTDDAYVGGDVIPITAQIAGTVISVNVEDTQSVSSNQLLIQLDKLDRDITLQEARAQLVVVIRTIQQAYLRNSGLEASLAQKKVDLEEAQKDMVRRQKVLTVGGVSEEELMHAKDALTRAEASVIQAESALEMNHMITDKTDVRHHPEVIMAIAHLKESYLNWRRTEIRAPRAGIIAKHTAQVGLTVTPGIPLMALVSLDHVWVDANFTEKQMSVLRIGQPVTLKSDFYDSSVVYHGKIMGMSPGTGSAFSLLPAQNATGNWIKVVQRLPVRIALLPEETKAHPLRIGLSMSVTVDTQRREGPGLHAVSEYVGAHTEIYQNLSQDAQTEVDALLDLALGQERSKPIEPVL